MPPSDFGLVGRRVHGLSGGERRAPQPPTGELPGGGLVDREVVDRRVMDCPGYWTGWAAWLANCHRLPVMP